MAFSGGCDPQRFVCRQVHVNTWTPHLSLKTQKLSSFVSFDSYQRFYGSGCMFRGLHFNEPHPFLVLIPASAGLHSSIVVSVLASQKDGPGSFACSPRAHLSFLPPTIQKQLNWSKVNYCLNSLAGETSRPLWTLVARIGTSNL